MHDPLKMPPSMNIGGGSTNKVTSVMVAGTPKVAAVPSPPMIRKPGSRQP